MRLRLLLSFMLFAGIINAQMVVCDYPEEVYLSLIISEARLSGNETYLEITNMGSEAVRLSEFKLGKMVPLSMSRGIKDLCNDAWYNSNESYLFLPDKMLDPGKSFVITSAFDYNPIHYKEYLGRLGGSERPKQIGIYEVADKLLHMEEWIAGVSYENDSISSPLTDPEQTVRRGDYQSMFGGDIYYLEHHYTEGDSAVVDQVGGVFDDPNGRNRNTVKYDVAGVTGGVTSSILVRKANITKGNIDFANGRGISLEDSEWIPIQILPGYNAWRDLRWTTGNHGNFILDENTLEPESDQVSVDYANKKVTVAWGMRRLDEIMRHMKKKPGVAWDYHLNSLQEDSLYRSARNGDQLTVYVVGNTMQSAIFDIVVNDPTADDNLVVPIDHAIVREPGEMGPVTTRAQNGILSWPRVTKNESGVDTITGAGFGLAFDLRTDSLLKYLEKAPKAGWEFVWVDGVERPDLKDGDKLLVTSESGKVKEYFIQVQSYFPSQNADLASITWPDIPELYRGLFGWEGDTIPGFAGGTTNYLVEVPLDVEGIPALITKTSELNATVKVTRAKSITGPIQDRTVTFEVTAEDDTVKKTYNVELVKEKLPNQIEPFIADPIISELVHSFPNANPYLEIYNPGNQPLDLSNYMVGLRSNTTDLYAPINHNPRWVRRYTTYVPGYKYVDEDTWNITPRMLLPDPMVNPIIPPKGTFVMAYVDRGNWQFPGVEDYIPQYDVNFRHNRVPGHPNPWNENVAANQNEGAPLPVNGNRRNHIFLYKILNDSVKNGLKPTSDPNDFELIDLMGEEDSYWTVVGDYEMGLNEMGVKLIRKPHIYQGNTQWGGSFGFGVPENSEWIATKLNLEFSHIPFPARYGAGLASLNQHYSIEPTFFKSTVASSVYKVSQGFGPNEAILGLKSGTTVSEFLINIIKEDEGQTLTVTSAADGSEMGMDAVIAMNDILVVRSADEQNTTHYRLDVTEAGLSNDAYLTSNRWNIVVDVAPKSGEEAGEGMGSVTGFDYGTTLKTVVDNVMVPAGATLSVINSDGAYIPYTILNFDTTYVSVTVNPDIYLNVVAEDGITRMVYQIKPSTSSNDAFILSDIYSVSQLDNLISFVPRGTNFQTFLSNIIPSLGATVKLVDKMGFERNQGNIREDDKVLVTSANGLTTRVYYISFLPTSTILSTTYLAYILSEAYAVDQVDYVIAGGIAPLTALTPVSEFLSYITPSQGATIVLMDDEGNEKVAGDLDDGDILKVTSADGKIVVIYELDLDLTSVTRNVMQQIEIYPNPTSGNLNISGVTSGDYIRIYDLSGTLIRDLKANRNLEVLSLEDVPSGMFLIVISNDRQMLGRYKAIKK